MTFSDYGVRLIASGNHINDWPYDAPTSTLWKLLATEKNPKQLHNIEAILQWRFAMPISVVLFALLALPLSEIRPRSGKFARLFPAILIYIVYADLMFLGRAWIQHGTLSPTLGLWWIHISAFLLAIFLNGQRIGWKRIISFFCVRKKYATS